MRPILPKLASMAQYGLVKFNDEGSAANQLYTLQTLNNDKPAGKRSKVHRQLPKLRTDYNVYQIIPRVLLKKRNTKNLRFLYLWALH